MKSNRLLTIASFISLNDSLIDVGCDHGYLGIYLKENNLIKEILLTDVNKNALNNAINNINKKNLNIDTYLTDGLNNIDISKYNTISMSGMGTKTILKILNNKDLSSINKLIIESNNDLDILRSEINKYGFYLNDEITIYENNIYYVICLFTKKENRLSEEEILFGLLKQDKIPYYNYLLNYYKSIYNKIPNNNKDKLKYKKYIDILHKLLKEDR